MFFNRKKGEKEKVATFVDTLHKSDSKVWCLKAFTSITGVQKVVVSTMGSMLIFDVEEDCSLLVNRKKYSPCAGFYNGIYYYRKPNEEKEYILIDNSQGNFFSFDVEDESVSYLSLTITSLAGYVHYQQIDERICAFNEFVDEKSNVYFFNLDRCIDDTKRYPIVPGEVPIVGNMGKRSEFVVGEVKIPKYPNIASQNLSCIRFSAKRKFLFFGGMVLGMINVQNGYNNCEIKKLEETTEKIWCMSLASSETGSDRLVVGKEKGTIELWDMDELVKTRSYKHIAKERIYRILCTGKFLIPICYSSVFVIINYIDGKYKNKSYEEVGGVEGTPYSATWIRGKDGMEKKYFLVGGEQKCVMSWKSIGEKKRLVDPDIQERILFIFERFEELFQHWTIWFGGNEKIKSPLLYI